MENETESFGVQKLNAIEALAGLGLPRNSDDKKKRDHPHEHLKKEARNFFHPLFKAAEATNEQLKKKNIPYRFHVYQEGDEVFIDMVILNARGEIVSTKKKNISHEDFERLIEDVSQIEGLLFDETA